MHSSRSCWGLQARSANHLPPRLVECMPLDLLVNRAGDTRRRQRTRFLIIEPWLEIASSTPAHWLWLGHWMAALPKFSPQPSSAPSAGVTTRFDGSSRTGGRCPLEGAKASFLRIMRSIAVCCGTTSPETEDTRASEENLPRHHHPTPAAVNHSITPLETDMGQLSKHPLGWLVGTRSPPGVEQGHRSDAPHDGELSHWLPLTDTQLPFREKSEKTLALPMHLLSSSPR